MITATQRTRPFLFDDPKRGAGMAELTAVQNHAKWHAAERPAIAAGAEAARLLEILAERE